MVIIVCVILPPTVTTCLTIRSTIGALRTRSCCNVATETAGHKEYCRIHSQQLRRSRIGLEYALQNRMLRSATSLLEQDTL